MTKIIWKRIHDTHSLMVHECDGEYLATTVTSDEIKSKEFQTFNGCHEWFTRELSEIGIEKSRVDYPHYSADRFAPKPKRWPNGDKIKKGES